jgi:hypothetical protein
VRCGQSTQKKTLPLTANIKEGCLTILEPLDSRLVGDPLTSVTEMLKRMG